MEDGLVLFQECICAWFPNWEIAQNNCEGFVKVIGVLILALLGGITRGGKRLIIFLMAFRAHSSLAPYVTRSEVRQSLKYFVPTRVQGTSPSDQPDFKKLQPSEPYIDFFINKVFRDADDSERFHLVLGGAGMGKTTFMINLAIRYRFSLMWRPWRVAYKIQFLPLWEENVIEKIQKINDPTKTILLLDALDEDPLAHAQVDQRLKDLVKAAKEFHTVIVTSRTQFFDTEGQIPDNTEVYRLNRYMEFDKMYVAPFSAKEIKKYLKKRFRLQFLRRKKAWNLVNQFRDIMARPMILAYIDDLLKGKKDYQFKDQVYGRIISNWVDRESNKPHVKWEVRDTYRKNLYSFSIEIARLIYEKYQKGEGQYLEDEVFTGLSVENGLTLDPKEMKGKSLLTRNSENQWKFAHKSIMVYFLTELGLTGRIDSDFPEKSDSPLRGSRIIDEGIARSEAGRWLAHQRPTLELATINEVKSKYYQFLFEESNDSPRAFFLAVIEFICLVMIDDITVTPERMNEYLAKKGVKENPSLKSVYSQLFSTLIDHIVLKRRKGDLPISQEASGQLFFFLKEFQKDYD